MLAHALRLGALFALIALTTSRLTLVVHELVGHGVMAELVGGDAERVQLFWFAGGFVEMSLPDDVSRAGRYAVFLGGVILELIAGAIALLLASRLRRDSIARLAVLAFGAINLIHAGFYLAAGTHHGYGDGRILHATLGAGRPFLVAGIAIVLCTGAFVLARRLLALVWQRLPGPRWHALAAVAGAIAIAAAVHAALAFGELAVRRDRTYAAVMQTESSRAVEREVADRLREQPRIDPAELERLRRDLDARHRQLPVRTLLLIAVALSILAAAVTARPPAEPAAPLTTRALRAPTLACAGAVGLVIALSALL